MGGLDYIARMIWKAQEIESRRPETAHAYYENAERRLEEHLVSEFGIFIDVLERNPNHSLSKTFLPYYKSIREGYDRLNAAKKAQASSL
jgi:hypothetical protein